MPRVGGVTKRGEKIPVASAGVMRGGGGDDLAVITSCDRHASAGSVLLQRSNSRGRNHEKIEMTKEQNQSSRGHSLPRVLFGRGGRGRSQEPCRRSNSVIGPIRRDRREDRSQVGWMRSSPPLVLEPVESNAGDGVELFRGQNNHSDCTAKGVDDGAVRTLFRLGSSSSGSALSSFLSVEEKKDGLLVVPGEHSGIGKTKSIWNRYFARKHWKTRQNINFDRDSRTGDYRSVDYTFDSTVESGTCPRSNARIRKTEGSTISADESARSGYDSDNYDHDAPWSPTESLLLKIGQLDRIDDDDHDEINVDNFENSVNNGHPEKDPLDSDNDAAVDDDTCCHHQKNGHAPDDDDDVGGERNDKIVKGGGSYERDKSDTHPSGGKGRSKDDDKYHNYQPSLKSGFVTANIHFDLEELVPTSLVKKIANDDGDKKRSMFGNYHMEVDGTMHTSGLSRCHRGDIHFQGDSLEDFCNRVSTSYLRLSTSSNDEDDQGSNNSSTPNRSPLSKGITLIGRGRSRSRKEGQENRKDDGKNKERGLVEASLLTATNPENDVLDRGISSSLLNWRRGRSSSVKLLRRSNTNASDELFRLQRGSTKGGKSNTKSLSPLSKRTRIEKSTATRSADDGDSLEDFCNRVSTRNQRLPPCHEGTSSKEEDDFCNRVSTSNLRLPSREGTSSKDEDDRGSNNSGSPKRSPLSKGITRIGRGRSRSRKEGQENRKDDGKNKERGLVEASLSTATNPDSDILSRGIYPSLFIWRRGRSFSANLLRRSNTNALDEPFRLQRGSTKGGTSNTKSLSPLSKRTRIEKSTTTRDDDNDNRASFSNSSSYRSSSLSCDVSNLSSSQKEGKNKSSKNRRRKCLVCRRIISSSKREEDGCYNFVRYMDFYFCSNKDESTCFQCGSCRRHLSPSSLQDDLDDDDGIRIISNARGSIVQCGQCARLLNGGGSVSSSLPSLHACASAIAVSSASSVALTAAAVAAHSSLDGVCDVCVENNEKPNDSRRGIQLLDESVKSRGNDSTARGGGGDNYAKVLSKAAKRLAEKVSVKIIHLGSCISNADNDDDADMCIKTERTILLSTLYFTQSEDGNNHSKRTVQQSHNGNNPIDERDNSNTTKVVYELDSDVFGNPNYDGYNCSFSQFDNINNDEDHVDASTNPVKPPQPQPRITTVSLPALESDEINGAITPNLYVKLNWVDDDDDPDHDTTVGECSARNDAGHMYIHPERRGPAILSIESFQSKTITKETVRKVLRQTWEYVDEKENLVYDFTFSVPFKKLYISWEIAKGDELDLSLCLFEVNVRYDPPNSEAEPMDLTVEAAPNTTTSCAIGGDVTRDHYDEDDDNDILTNSVDDNLKGPVTTARVFNDDAMRNVRNGDDDDNNNYICHVSAIDDISTGLNSVGSIAISKDATRNLRPNLSIRGCIPSVVHTRTKTLDPDRDDNDNISELLSAASCINAVILLPLIFCIKIEKKYFDEEIGLSLIEMNGATVVAEVSKSGLFANSPIKEGCVLLAINGQCLRGPRSVIRIMKDLVGMLAITMSDCPSPPGSRFVVTKSKLKKFGEEMKDITFNMSHGLVRVQAVAENGIFSQSQIKDGDICLSIDGIPAVSDGVATRVLGRSHSFVSILIFSLPEFWKRIVDYLVDTKYVRWWQKDSECKLYLKGSDFAPITLSFDAHTGLCSEDNNEEHDVDLKCMNTIIDRVMKLLMESINACHGRGRPDKERRSGRSLSVSASGKITNRSDVYRRALIKLDEMRENGKLSPKDYEAGKHALAQLAIQTAR
ncbi:hypothetical protein ACHAXA_001860 [Cyclostephanos tholiformis]|uniref:PDZ domain-containing protein n=1 Tax=Cyclostephanos tholiformis TaxID=382380 RepID=A0ABD3RH28_9STRA